MEIIELNAYEKKDLIEALEYAKEQKLINKPEIEIRGRQTRKFDTTEYDVSRIQNLIDIIKSKKERISLNKNKK